MQSKKRSSSSKKKKKKSKVYIPVEKIIALCSILVGLCVILLLITYSLDGKNKTKQESKTDTQPIVSPIEKSTSMGQEVRNDSYQPKNNEIPKEVKRSEAPEKEPEKKTQKSETKTEIKKPEAERSVKKDIALESKTADSKTKQKQAEDVKVLQEKKKPMEEVKTSVPSQKEKIVQGDNLPPVPQAVNGAKLVIIFDDGGQNLNQLEKCITLPFPVTVAVLPRLSHSREAASLVRSSGNEVILHQPMQSVNPNVNPGEGAIKPGMGEDEIRNILFYNINEIAPITGMNNHEGSLITADAEQMSFVLKIASDEGLYFLDSRTNVETKVPYVSKALGYSYYERNIFLDNKKTRENIISEFMKGVSIANKKGVVIMIGHVWSADILPAVLLELSPILREKGYRFTTVSNSGALITP